MTTEPENVSTETVNVQGNRISVSFSRKLSDGNYGGSEATAWVQGEVNPDATPAEVATALAGLFQSGKVAVLDELGIQWNCDEQGMVRETITPFVSTAHAEAAVARVLGEQKDSDNGGIKVMNVGKPDASGEPLPQWLIDECNALGITGVWDKRGTRQGKQPHFTEAIPRGAEGHGKGGEAKAFWPPRS